MCCFWPNYQLIAAKELSNIIHYVSTDIDECAITNGSCTPGGQCVNQPGDYTCDCHSGYILDNSAETPTCRGKSVKIVVLD